MSKAASRKPTEPHAVIVTCEHAGNRVPVPYRKLFHGAETILDSHRGWDPGALKLAQTFASQLNAPMYSATVTRLLVELNRSLGHHQLFSEFTSSLNDESKSTLLDQHWHPYRRSVEAAISNEIDAGNSVLHLSVHSFTPDWNGQPRTTDVGLLYDPARPHETQFCCRWQANLRTADSKLTVHRNAPYRGVADGFVTALRRIYPPNKYAGIELEVNQKYLNDLTTWQPTLATAIVTSYQQTLLALP